MTILLHDLAAQGDRRFSPFCWRSKYALAHKGLAFEARPAAFTDIPALCGGRYKTVPILEDGDRAVGDSWAIADYLEEAYPDRPRLFGSPGERGLCRFVDCWILTTLPKWVFHVYVLDIHDSAFEKDRAYFRQSREAMLGCTLEEAVAGREGRLEEARASFEPVRALLSQGQPFLSGERAGYADYMLGGILLWIASIGTLPLLRADDPLAAYHERFRDLYGGLGRTSPMNALAA